MHQTRSQARSGPRGPTRNGRIGPHYLAASLFLLCGSFTNLIGGSIHYVMTMLRPRAATLAARA
ncbi:hypothetical protein QTH97_25010 [Variovorax sp. J22R24]|uniref:hypothetical protein n=1 Tax=Variovorax gracilis TaxID=3053502 RepID=UPI002577315B|nr:hypothetical protein [Variovorax sp. J22R24]MDM0108233.1 hypothetical protein [Variovorax sp. J22R24]